MKGERERVIIKEATLSASGFVTNRSRILLAQQQDGTWGLPAGGFRLKENGELEEPEEAFLRELEEETGYKKEDLSLLFFKGSLILPPEADGDKYRLGFIFSAEIFGSPLRREPKPIDKSIINAKFFSGGEAINLVKSKKIYKPRFNAGIIVWWWWNWEPEYPVRSDPFNSQTIKELGSIYD